jgi:hypothetical protein
VSSVHLDNAGKNINTAVNLCYCMMKYFLRPSSCKPYSTQTRKNFFGI